MPDSKTALIERHIFWQPWSEPGLEHLHLVQDRLGVRADGLVIGVRDGAPFRLHYQIECDPGWQVRALEVRLLDPPHRRIMLRAGEEGHWTDAGGGPVD